MEELSDSGLKIVTTRITFDSNRSKYNSELKDVLLRDLIENLDWKRFPAFFIILNKLNKTLTPVHIPNTALVETIINGSVFQSEENQSVTVTTSSNFALMDYHHSLKELRETIEFYSENEVILRKAEDTPFRVLILAMIRRNYVFPEISKIFRCLKESGIYDKWIETHGTKQHLFNTKEIKNAKVTESYANFFMKRMTGVGGKVGNNNWQEAKSVSLEFLGVFFVFLMVLVGIEVGLFCGEINLPRKVWRWWRNVQCRICKWWKEMKKRRRLAKLKAAKNLITKLKTRSSRGYKN